MFLRCVDSLLRARGSNFKQVRYTLAENYRRCESEEAISSKLDAENEGIYLSNSKMVLCASSIIGLCDEKLVIK